MNARTWVASLCLLAGCATAHPAAAPQLVTDEAAIRTLEEQERLAVLDQDFAALERIWSPRFMVNTPGNEVAPERSVVLDIFRQGIAHYSSFERKIEQIRIDGDIAIVMGSETVKPIGNAPRAETVQRRYTNIWKKEAGTWHLIARHANVVAPEPAQAGAERANAEPTLDAVRRATERFRDVAVALAEGYLRDPMDMCVTAEMIGRPATDGRMGIHFFRPDLQGVIPGVPGARVTGTGTHTDFLTPTNLLYEPQADGSLELIGVENLVFVQAWEKEGHSGPPAFEGVPYDRMKDDPSTPVDEAHGFEPHYDRHVWLYRENPRGVFKQFNPNVSCIHHVPAAASTH